MDRIDLTPASLTTPEGVARANAAIELQEKAILTAADALSDLLDALDGVKLPETAMEALREARHAHGLRRSADESLLRALAAR